MNKKLFFSIALFSAALFLALTPFESALARELCDGEPSGQCWEGQVSGTIGHDFAGGGAPYKCAPNGCHGTTTVGYCHQTHFPCNVE